MPPRLSFDRLNYFLVQRRAGIEVVDITVARLESRNAEVEQADIPVLVADVDEHALAHTVAFTGTAGDLEHHSAARARYAGALLRALQADVVDGAVRSDAVAQSWRGKRSGRGRRQCQRHKRQSNEFAVKAWRPLNSRVRRKDGVGLSRLPR